jgi:hypothetical protein
MIPAGTWAVKPVKDELLTLVADTAHFIHPESGSAAPLVTTKKKAALSTACCMMQPSSANPQGLNRLSKEHMVATLSRHWAF